MKKEIRLKIGKQEISFDILMIGILLIMLFTGYLTQFIITLISIFLHELGHIFMAKYLGCAISNIRILPVGMNAVIDDNMCSMRERLIIDISGPFVNILLALFSFLLSLSALPIQHHTAAILWINIFLMAFNLLPVLPLDGGRILREALAERFGIIFAGRFMRRFSLFFSIFVLLFGTYLWIHNRNNFSLIIIGFYIFSTSSFKKTEAAIMNIKSVIYRRSRLMKKGIYAARDLVVMQSIAMSELLKSMDFDRFHIIHVLDENLKLIRTFTEHEIIEGMLKYDTDITFEEFIKKEL